MTDTTPASSPMFKGCVYHWQGCDLIVRRVARDGAWADVRVQQRDTGAVWSKRQPLPLPQGATFVGIQVGGAR